LAPDQCTIYYTSEGTSVLRFNVCTNSQGTAFATALPGSAAYTLRLLPGGGALVADSETIVRLDASGAVVQQYDDPAATGIWFSLALDPDGKTFWAGDPNTGEVAHFDIASGSLLSSFTTGTGSFDQAGGLAIAR
jgi:DNA-binding beta-propeller fold protein YncE